MLKFKQINETDTKEIKSLIPLWFSYMRELYNEELDIQSESDEKLIEWLNERIKVQGQRDCIYFEGIYYDGLLAGFVFYAIDLGGIKGIIEPGLGYIMEMYVVPNLRRQKIGTTAFEHMKEVLSNDGAMELYLTPDIKSGVHFWKSIGFKDSGKVDPDNKAPIYIMAINAANKSK